MAKECITGGKYFLPVTVERIVEGDFGVTLSYSDGDEGDTALIWNAPDLLLTADEIATDINTERAEIMEGLGKQNLELSKQNEELSARVEELTDLTNYYIAERQRDNLNIRLLLDKIAELEGEKNG